MTKRDMIEVDLDDLPYSVDIPIEDTVYTLSFEYNEVARSYSVDVADADGNDLYLGWRLILNQPLWYGIADQRLPVWSIIPMDESGQAKELTPENFQRSVFLLIDDLVDDEVTTDG